MYGCQQKAGSSNFGLYMACYLLNNSSALLSLPLFVRPLFALLTSTPPLVKKKLVKHAKKKEKSKS